MLHLLTMAGAAAGICLKVTLYRAKGTTREAAYQIDHDEILESRNKDS